VVDNEQEGGRNYENGAAFEQVVAGMMDKTARFRKDLCKKKIQAIAGVWELIVLVLVFIAFTVGYNVAKANGNPLETRLTFIVLMACTAVLFIFFLKMRIIRKILELFNDELDQLV